MTSSLMKCALAITIGGFVAACSSNPKPIQPEIAAATPPPPASIQITDTPREPSLVLDDVLFDFAQATLKPEANRTVSKAVTYLQDNPDRNALIEGHTDHVGDDDYNQTLSTRRSDVIGNALIALGINPSRITSVGLGESRPVANNDTVEGRQSNRRVEIIFTENRQD